MNPTQPLDISETKDGILMLRFSGNLLQDAAEVFKTELEDATKKIEALCTEQKRKIKILLDMTDFTGEYNAETLQMLAQFAKNNAPYVEKTASFGGSDKVKAAGEAAIALAGRNNISIFDTREEALSFLNK